MVSRAQVQVSRMMSLPFRAMSVVPVGTLATSVPERNAHSLFSSPVTAGTIGPGAHFIVSGANSPPRHRCYALLSPALSRLVRESHCNSYYARQDGLW